MVSSLLLTVRDTKKSEGNISVALQNKLMNKQREIKFRAWDKKEKRMVIWINNEGYGCYGSPQYEDYNVSGNDRFIPLQYTGLHDKNGKEIYEGDIIKYILDSYQIFWWDLEFRWAGKRQDDKEVFSLARICEENQGLVEDGIEIIGNIYENPELLK